MTVALMVEDLKNSIWVEEDATYQIDRPYLTIIQNDENVSWNSKPESGEAFLLPYLELVTPSPENNWQPCYTITLSTRN